MTINHKKFKTHKALLDFVNADRNVKVLSVTINKDREYDLFYGLRGKHNARR